MHPRIKICCISSREEAKIAIQEGASALGLVGKMPSGPGVISDDMIREIASYAPPAVSTFLLTSETDPEAIIKHHRRTLTTAIQIVDALPLQAYPKLRSSLPGIKLVQVIHVMDESAIDKACAVSEHVDGLLLDSGNPGLEIKVLGGTGRLHNWKISSKIVDSVDVPVFLAGGLNPENAQRAIEEVQPFGLDVCSGVRTNSRLDPAKIKAFFKAVSRTLGSCR